MENNLKVLRAKHNLSQHKLAQLAEVSRQTIHAIESGKFSPSLSVAFRISQIFSEPVENVFIHSTPTALYEHHLKSYR